MTDLQTLTQQRDELLAKIREIESSCEGIENEHNAQRVQELNLEHAQLSAQKQELSAKLSAMESHLSAISSEITKLSGTGIDRILEAIKNQRWYFFKNKTKILIDKLNGFIYPNIETCYDRNDDGYLISPDISTISNCEWDGFTDWILPTKKLVEMAEQQMAGKGQQ